MSRLFILTMAALLVVALVSCSDDNKPTSSNGNPLQPLAGGGRFSDSDPFDGKSDSTLPDWPDTNPYPGYLTLFYSDISCNGKPQQRVITTTEDWHAWWDSATACMAWYPPDDPWPWPCDTCPADSGLRTGMVDSVVVDTTVSTCDTCGWQWESPEVNFDDYVVVIIGLEEDTVLGRAIWIDEVLSSSPGSIIHYVVSRLGDDCYSMIMSPLGSMTTSPVMAVQVPRPVEEPVVWERSDTVYSCYWEPDPHEPLTIYYTDSPCDLGPSEQLITDQATYDAWLAAAISCDSARWWYGLADSAQFVITTPWYGFEVDFSSHAVIVLRGDEQSQWGGGVWLTEFDLGSSRTTIAYTVMTPSPDCPPVDGLPSVIPTVAVRIPRPASDNIEWKRSTEPINCSWPTDSSGWTEPGQSGGGK